MILYQRCSKRLEGPRKKHHMLMFEIEASNEKVRMLMKKARTAELFFRTAEKIARCLSVFASTLI